MTERFDTSGECRDCSRRHLLPVGNARAHAIEMMRGFEKFRRLDYFVTKEEADPRLAFANLFSSGRGNMFGVMECEDLIGKTVVLRAFSSLWEGIREVKGWVSPNLSTDLYDNIILPAQAEIKAMTAEMANYDARSSDYREIEARRRGVSQALWKRMCAEYRFQNFHGEERALVHAMLPGSPISGGVGECCAPKLLNHAARNGLRPLGLAEFYWGDETKSSRADARVQGEFYPSCQARCQPLLGFLLCGLDELERAGHS